MSTGFACAAAGNGQWHGSWFSHWVSPGEEIMDMLRLETPTFALSAIDAQTTVVIVDHHRLCQQRLASALHDIRPGLKVRTVSFDLAAVCQLLSRTDRATLVVSCCDESIQPLALLFNVRARFPGVKLVALHAPPRLQSAYSPGAESVEAVIHATSGVRALLRAIGAAPEPIRMTEAGFAPRHLTPRERDVVGHVAAGMRNAEIAETIGIKEKTVKVNLTNIFAKLGLRRREELIALAPRLLAPAREAARA
jgi:DNA-binding NarL/FixJ family response regulator